MGGGRPYPYRGYLMTWNIYLAGEIHSDWRDKIIDGSAKENLPVVFSSPVTDHAASDNCGPAFLGSDSDGFWKDHKSAKINAIRTRTSIGQADVVVVRFGEHYRQWNAAFDAGYAVAMGKPLVTLHDADLQHALKEVDATALAVASTAQQVVDILNYVINQK